MIPNNAYDIQVSVDMFQALLMKKFVGRVSHGLSSIKSLTPCKWVGRQLTKW